MSAPTAPLLRRPVGRGQAWAVLWLATLLWLAGAAATTWLVLQRGYSETLIGTGPQAGTAHTTVVLPPGLRADVDVEAALDTQLNWTPRLRIPINQRARITLPQTLTARTRVDTVLPIATEVSYRGEVPVRTEVNLRVAVSTWLPPFDVRLPVALSLPVNMTVPVRMNFPIALDLAVRSQLDRPLDVPLRTTLDVRLPLRVPLRVKVSNRLEMALIEGQPVDLDINAARIALPLQALQWRRATPPDPAAPESPGGQADQVPGR